MSGYKIVLKEDNLETPSEITRELPPIDNPKELTEKPVDNKPSPITTTHVVQNVNTPEKKVDEPKKRGRGRPRKERSEAQIKQNNEMVKKRLSYKHLSQDLKKALKHKDEELEKLRGIESYYIKLVSQRESETQRLRKLEDEISKLKANSISSSTRHKPKTKNNRPAAVSTTEQPAISTTEQLERIKAKYQGKVTKQSTKKNKRLRLFN